jgi:hypothetical protein
MFGLRLGQRRDHAAKGILERLEHRRAPVGRRIGWVEMRAECRPLTDQAGVPKKADKEFGEKEKIA